MRIAFLSSEFASEQSDAGGLASYLGRCVQALRDQGHEPEVFTQATSGGAIEWRGVRVERVARRAWPNTIERGLQRFAVARSAGAVRDSAALCAALEARHREQPFDAVQSANYRSPALWLGRRRARRHIARLSSLATLWAEARGPARRRDDQLEALLEGRALARCDAIYAPSVWLAERAADRLGRPVSVLRPPFFLGVEPDKQGLSALPQRFLLHAGKPGRIKGSDRLARALPIAWRSEPELRVVISGHVEPAFAERCSAHFGARATQVQWIPPQPQRRLFALMREACALVAVSRCDNLPNLALEALALELPLVADCGASYAELVSDGRNGRLCRADDAEALAAGLVEAWRGCGPFAGGRLPRSAIWDELEPATAARSLLRFLESGEAPAAAGLARVA
jgi:glycosyltransferase involved in cell wall biosynthesis